MCENGRNPCFFVVAVRYVSRAFGGGGFVSIHIYANGRLCMVAGGADSLKWCFPSVVIIFILRKYLPPLRLLFYIHLLT